MIFQYTADLVMSGRKTVTRRRKAPDDVLMSGKYGIGIYRPSNAGGVRIHNALWLVGRDYSVQPGRGEAAIGRIRILDIAEGKPSAVSDADARLEGFETAAEFVAVYMNMHGRRALEEPCWIFTFEVVK
jgi:hypothetical protein